MLEASLAAEKITVQGARHFEQMDALSGR